MITPCQMYWLVTLDSIIAMSVTLAIILALTTSLIVCVALDCGKGLWGAALTAFMAIACALVATFTPSTKQMAAIIFVPRIANSEKVQTAGNKLYDLAVEWMDELKPRKDGAKEAK